MRISDWSQTCALPILDHAADEAEDAIHDRQRDHADDATPHGNEAAAFLLAGDAGDHASEDQEHKSGHQADRRGYAAGDLAGRKDVNALDGHRFLPMPAGCLRFDSIKVRGQGHTLALDLAGHSEKLRTKPSTK